MAEVLDEKNKKTLEFIEDITINAAEIQKRVLLEILKLNADVEYLRRHGLTGHLDDDHVGFFKKRMPVVEYEHLKHDIERIANGDRSPILCSEPISEFLTSSGTSGGERKLLPATADDIERRMSLGGLIMPVINQFIPNLDQGKGMYFMFTKSESRTPGGLLAHPATTCFFKSKHFINRPHNAYTNYTSPNETILCTDSYQSMYSQLLCGLVQNTQVFRVGAFFASSFIRVIKFLKENWPTLANDIRNGTIDAKISDASVRESVLKILKPNPELADFVGAQCGEESWEGIITRLWPNTKYIDVVVTGAMSQYISTLDFYSKGLPLVSTAYGSSECNFGVNLNPMCKPSEVSYTFIPTMAYFEFIPVESENGKKSVQEMEGPKCVDLVDVKVGHEYEIVVTTYAGLYRYRVGDILRVSGFKNNAPQCTFICRKNVVLSIDTDKTDEVDLQNAVNNASIHLIPFDATLIDYTSYADTSTIPGHYVLYWEISAHGEKIKIPQSVFEDCCLTCEESLNSVYRQKRSSDKFIGPLEIKVVENGTFDKLMDYALSSGASMGQYKTPRCVTNASIVELLNARVVSNYFSPKCPKWVSGYKQWGNINNS